MEAATKRCSACKTNKPLDDFHHQRSGKFGRFCYCKPCANEKQRNGKKRTTTPEKRYRWNLSARYGITQDIYDGMKERQGGRCAICREVPKRWCVDHCHSTGKVRGLLCHRCNIFIAAMEDSRWRDAAARYLDEATKCDT